MFLSYELRSRRPSRGARRTRVPHGRSRDRRAARGRRERPRLERGVSTRKRGGRAAATGRRPGRRCDRRRRTDLRLRDSYAGSVSQLPAERRLLRGDACGRHRRDVRLARGPRHVTRRRTHECEPDGTGPRRPGAQPDHRRRGREPAGFRRLRRFPPLLRQRRRPPDGRLHLGLRDVRRG